jgi:hypothetical protein
MLSFCFQDDRVRYERGRRDWTGSEMEEFDYDVTLSVTQNMTPYDAYKGNLTDTATVVKDELLEIDVSSTFLLSDAGSR